MQVDLSAATFWNGAFWPGGRQEKQRKPMLFRPGPGKSALASSASTPPGGGRFACGAGSALRCPKLIAKKKRSAIRYVRYLLPRPPSLALEPG
jgi:hypothetical protein